MSYLYQPVLSVQYLVNRFKYAAIKCAVKSKNVSLSILKMHKIRFIPGMCKVASRHLLSIDTF